MMGVTRTRIKLLSDAEGGVICKIVYHYLHYWQRLMEGDFSLKTMYVETHLGTFMGGCTKK